VKNAGTAEHSLSNFADEILHALNKKHVGGISCDVAKALTLIINTSIQVFMEYQV
jgi:hypothetical protein